MRNSSYSAHTHTCLWSQIKGVNWGRYARCTCIYCVKDYALSTTSLLAPFTITSSNSLWATNCENPCKLLWRESGKWALSNFLAKWHQPVLVYRSGVLPPSLGLYCRPGASPWMSKQALTLAHSPPPLGTKQWGNLIWNGLYNSSNRMLCILRCPKYQMKFWYPLLTNELNEILIFIIPF